MTIEQQALDLINKVEELEVHNYLLRKALTDLFNGGWDNEHIDLISNQAKIALESTPEQFLNSVKADAVEEFFKYMLGEGMVSDNGVDPSIDDFLNDGLLTPLKLHYVDKLRST